MVVVKRQAPSGLQTPPSYSHCQNCTRPLLFIEISPKSISTFSPVARHSIWVKLPIKIQHHKEKKHLFPSKKHLFLNIKENLKNKETQKKCLARKELASKIVWETGIVFQTNAYNTRSMFSSSEWQESHKLRKNSISSSLIHLIKKALN